MRVSSNLEFRITQDLCLGTLAPFLRASESPMAIACLRLLTLPPLPPRPDFRVPRFFLRIALATRLPAAFPYLRPELLLERLVAAIRFSCFPVVQSKSDFPL